MVEVDAGFWGQGLAVFLVVVHTVNVDNALVVIATLLALYGVAVLVLKLDGVLAAKALDHALFLLRACLQRHWRNSWRLELHAG